MWAILIAYGVGSSGHLWAMSFQGRWPSLMLRATPQMSGRSGTTLIAGQLSTAPTVQPLPVPRGILLHPVARRVLGAGALTWWCWVVCSRVDTEVDKRLDAIGSPEAQQLKGKAAVAQAKLAYELAQK